ncbi:sigma factor G inhibitor Gin [Pradoshia eiseniae]|uniref:Sigma factor G inhibitor Gin n=1 Tax=Pradoshia eiseniae TaxID=2064768 RepID=A0A2S7MVU2_9BACI|nr:sigma factor G inhibitor Gin [Pradoshia eiseniae]PQD93931.1 sigma factor G inhibitor Gin [Pradoshia eiseniae]
MAIFDAAGKDFKQLGDKCCICEREKSEGLHLYIGYICAECEKAIVHTDTSDPIYQEYVEKLRKNNISSIFT